MRIVSGRLKGRPISAPKGRGTRPTANRTRESLFNILAHADWAPPLLGARVIDLFAGSGALGLEAMSRGAAFCLFVEKNADALSAIGKNIETLQLGNVTRLYRRSATSLGDLPENIGAPFDVAFLDPPYHKGLVAPCLNSLKDGGWLAKDTLAIVETGAAEEMELAGWDHLDERIYGAAKIVFLKAL